MYYAAFMHHNEDDKFDWKQVLKCFGHISKINVY